MVSTRARRGRRVLQSLSQAQHDDHYLAPSVVYSIRYNMLHYHQLCAQVVVDLEEYVPIKYAGPVFCNLSNFLRSQLEPQHITDEDDCSLWTRVQPLAHFIQCRSRKINSPRSYPTLFRWYCREKHRSFTFFAFLEIKMASKTYSGRELLHLRHLPMKASVVKKLYESLKKDGELKDIIRIPDQVLSLATEETKETHRKSEDRPTPHRASARQLDGTDSEWKYTGRTDSEYTEAHPISAPTGLSAQKDEGFKRFFKAVVSPTHVRVTAGGRIVPNTRGSSSPTAKWSKERTAGDSAPGSRPQSSSQPEPVPYPAVQNNLGGYPTMFPGVAPGMPSRVVPGSAQIPFMPVPFGYNMGGGYAMPPSAFNPFQATGALPTRLDSTGNNIQGDNGKPKLVQISPPEQFDPSLPFCWNGHWMISQGQQIYPYGMVPPQAFTAASTNGPIMVTQGAGLTPVAPQVGLQASQYVQTPQHVSGSSSVGPAAPKACTDPPKSSIRASDITKRQIEGLRQHLKYLEDQVQYNRHQIDEKFMEVQAQEVRQQIQSFEKVYEEQLSSERGQDGKIEKLKSSDSSAPSFPPSRTRSGIPTTSDLEFDQSSTKSLESQDKKSQTSISRSKPGKTQLTYRPTPALNPSKSASAFTAATLPLGTSSENPERLRKVSSLPMKAALAPPFQPRTEVNTPSVTGNSVGPETGEAIYPLVAKCIIPKGKSPFKSYFQNGPKPTLKGPPYLVGALPPGIPEESARDTDYIYSRELTEDELRARHMYWGKTPDHLQKGLPKYDGRHFYPPSPVKGSSADTSSSSNDVGQQPSAAVVDQSSNLETDPFQGLAETGPAALRNRIGEATQSESLPRFEQTTDFAPGIARPDSCISQIGPSYADFRKALDQTIQLVSNNSNSKSSSSEGDDDKNLIFKGRQAMIRTADKGQGAVWQNMLKKGSSSANAAPGKVSPMTAQGVLPNYSGHATASLTPAIANTTSSRGPGSKHSEPNDARLIAEKRGENRPPAENIVDESAHGAGL